MSVHKNKVKVMVSRRSIEIERRGGELQNTDMSRQRWRVEIKAGRVDLGKSKLRPVKRLDDRDERILGKVEGVSSAHESHSL